MRFQISCSGTKGERRQIYHLVDHHDLPVIKLGKKLYARKSSLVDWVEGREKKPSGRFPTCNWSNELLSRLKLEPSEMIGTAHGNRLFPWESGRQPARPPSDTSILLKVLVFLGAWLSSAGLLPPCEQCVQDHSVAASLSPGSNPAWTQPKSCEKPVCRLATRANTG